MAYEQLRHFVERLRADDELLEIDIPVSPDLEITEITDRVSKSGGPALLFNRPVGSEIPLLINAFGSERRMAAALGVDRLDAIAERIHELLHTVPPATWRERLALIPKLLELGRYTPKRVRTGRCQEVVETENPSLDALPIMRCWPQDGGPYITLPQVITRHVRTGKVNVGMYRLQKFDATTLGMHWQIHKVGAEHEREAIRQGESRMPVAIVLGGDPAMIYAATAPLPPEIDEFLFAGFLRQSGVELAPCRTIDMEVPANAEIVLEGYVVPGETRLEGPFGDHTGYYSLADQYPVFHLTAVTMARDPIYPSIIVGKPPMEDAYLGKATERIFLPMLQMTLPEIVDINLPPETLFHSLVLVSIRKSFPGHARKVAHALWGLGQMAFAKTIIVLDEEVDIHNPLEVAWRYANNVAPKRDIDFVMGPVDVLDNSAEHPGYGSKMVIDATQTWPEEGFSRTWPPDVVMDAKVRERIDQLWPELGLEGRHKPS